MPNPAVAWYRLCRVVHRMGLRRFSLLLSVVGRVVFGMWVPGSVAAGKNLSLGYWGLGIVVHKDAVLGKNCSICQHVTIGRKADQPGVPRLMDNVYIGAGAVLLGPIVVGDGAVIGANSVVVKDVPANCVVAGVPARPIVKSVA